MEKSPVQEPVACLTEVDGMTMVWPIADYNEACTYCDHGENPVLLYTAAAK